jgi:hypothetical protein
MLSNNGHYPGYILHSVTVNLVGKTWNCEVSVCDSFQRSADSALLAKEGPVSLLLGPLGSVSHFLLNLFSFQVQLGKRSRFFSLLLLQTPPYTSNLYFSNRKYGLCTVSFFIIINITICSLELYHSSLS